MKILSLFDSLRVFNNKLLWEVGGGQETGGSRCIGRGGSRVMGCMAVVVMSELLVLVMLVVLWVGVVVGDSRNVVGAAAAGVAVDAAAAGRSRWHKVRLLHDDIVVGVAGEVVLRLVHPGPRHGDGMEGMEAVEEEWLILQMMALQPYGVEGGGGGGDGEEIPIVPRPPL